MADYFSEMGWTPLGEGETPNSFLHMARLFRDFNMFDELNLMNGQKLPPPASKSAVESIPNISVSEDGLECPVCLKKHEKEEMVKKLPCNHLYHEQCIMPWLSKTNSCPLCRYEFPTDDEDYEAWRREKRRVKEREAEIEILHNSMFS